MERPALQRLLADIQNGRVDTVVVYKVDRLTRSLADFAKMVEVFDAHGASFVAVTQQFNTTTSMGRLTLNILLSFAQFEREVTGERIRDKIAASKRRGMWMGGTTPLGYQVIDGKLVVVPDDAATVVQLYRRYLELGSVRELKTALDAEGILSKSRTFASGRQAGGTPYSRGALYALLSNPVYLGQIRHKDAIYPGQHQAIVPAELHAAVQGKLADSNNGGPGRPRARVEPSLLVGKLFDSGGERLVPSHTRNGERRYHYYVSASLIRAKAASTNKAAGIDATAQGWRLPAQEIEQAVWSATVDVLQQPAALTTDLLAAGLAPECIPSAIRSLSQKAKKQTCLGHLVQRVELSPDSLLLTIDAGTGIGPAGSPSPSPSPSPSTGKHPMALTIKRLIPLRVQRRGVEMRLVIDAPGAPSRDDPALLKAVARAHHWFDTIVEGRTSSMQELAQQLGVTPRYVQRLLPLALMAPTMMERIVAGQHPPALTVEMLEQHSPLPMCWAEQMALLDR